MLVGLEGVCEGEELNADLAEGASITLFNRGLPEEHGKNGLAVFQQTGRIMGFVNGKHNCKSLIH